MKYTKKFKEDIIRRSDEIGLGNTFDELNKKKKKGAKVPSYQTIGAWRTEKRKEIGKEKDKKIADLEDKFYDNLAQIDIDELRETKKDLKEIKKSLSEIKEFKEKLRAFSATLRKTFVREKEEEKLKS